MTEVPPEVVNLISHATQSRLRGVVEKVSVIAQHRTDGGKVRTHTHVTVIRCFSIAARRCLNPEVLCEHHAVNSLLRGHLCAGCCYNV